MPKGKHKAAKPKVKPLVPAPNDAVSSSTEPQHEPFDLDAWMKVEFASVERARQQTEATMQKQKAWLNEKRANEWYKREGRPRVENIDNPHWDLDRDETIKLIEDKGTVLLKPRKADLMFVEDMFGTCVSIVAKKWTDADVEDSLFLTFLYTLMTFCRNILGMHYSLAGPDVHYDIQQEAISNEFANYFRKEAVAGSQYAALADTLFRPCKCCRHP